MHTPEAIVPTYEVTKNGGVLNTADTLLQRAVAPTGSWLDCPAADNACTSVTRTVNQKVSDRVTLVAPRKEPQVAAPLGWVLSQASRDALGTIGPHGVPTGQIGAQSMLHCPAHTANQTNCPAGIDGFADLLNLIGPELPNPSHTTHPSSGL